LVYDRRDGRDEPSKSHVDVDVRSFLAAIK